ncbi:hypothetical protein IKO18_05910 [bacterium]|nr:hypothetical protein [bacterium]
MIYENQGIEMSEKIVLQIVLGLENVLMDKLINEKIVTPALKIQKMLVLSHGKVNAEIEL